MKLYDFMKQHPDQDFDCWDTEYDECITLVNLNSVNPQDPIDEYCIRLSKLVDYVDGSYDGTCIIQCEWTKFIENNFFSFKSFTDRNWDLKNVDDDQYIEAIIRELHGFAAGYMNDEFYSSLNEFIDTLSGEANTKNYRRLKVVQKFEELTAGIHSVSIRRAAAEAGYKHLTTDECKNIIKPSVNGILNIKCIGLQMIKG